MILVAGREARVRYRMWWWTACIAGVFVVAGAIGLTTIRYLGQPSGGPEGIVAALALAAPFYGAGVIGLLGLVGSRPGYSFAAALALLPMSMISIATIPLHLAALALFAFAIRTEPRGRRMIADVPLAGPLVVALFLLLMHQDPAEWQTANGSGSASDVITTVEAMCSFTLVGAAVLVAWLGIRRAHTSATVRDWRQGL